jgi:uroporphyrinogen decarboxylase
LDVDMPLTNRERYFRTMAYESVDCRPFLHSGPWRDTVARWEREGLPAGTDVYTHLGTPPPLRVVNVSGQMGPYPAFATRTLSEDGNIRIFIDGYGRTVRDFTDHTSMPEWLDFPVKTPDDLRRVLDDHYQVDEMDARFTSEWEATVRAASENADLLFIDGGCFYWTLRSLAGVEHASYLFHDAPELVDELFARYAAVVQEGMRRAMALTQVDLVGFGEDIGFKTGPLISPATFRASILPHYRAAMATAHRHGVRYTWYDSDGDLRQLIPDYLDAGINGISPCEVAASMDPVALRRQFGRDLRMVGGVDKREIARGRAAIDAELDRLRPVIDDGGFLPAIDHSVSSDISLADFCYYTERLVGMLGY